MIARCHEISDRLAAIAEELSDLELETLRECVEAGETKPSEDVKRLSRARRAVEKAANLLDPPA